MIDNRDLLLGGSREAWSVCSMEMTSDSYRFEPFRDRYRKYFD